MAQVTIYLDDDLENKIRKAAQSMNISVSKWIAGNIADKVNNEWPLSVREAAGTWNDMPPLEEIRAQETTDSTREKL